MKYKVVSVHDRAADAYGRPVFAQTEGQAIRSFGDEIQRAAPDNEMYRHPEDYDLYLVAEFDDQNGQFTNTQDGPKQLGIGKHFAKGE